MNILFFFAAAILGGLAAYTYFGAQEMDRNGAYSTVVAERYRNRIMLSLVGAVIFILLGIFL